MLVPLSISNRHIHLSKKDADALFGDNYEFKKLKDLSQIWQFANIEMVTIQWPKWKIENVRILWPFRNQTQVEIMLGDTYILGVDAPIRLSWNLVWTPWIEMIWPKWKIVLESGVIVAQRHIHCDPKTAQENNLINWQNVKIVVDWSRGLIFDNVQLRIHEKFVWDCHLDVEEGNAAWVKMMMKGEVIA